MALGISRHLPFGLLSAPWGRRLVAPFYHAVSDQPMPHIRHLYQVKNVGQFEQDLDFLLKNYAPIDFRELAHLDLQNAKYKSKPPFLLSFDDGLREFNDPIAPILLRKGVPAICFLNSGFLDNTDLFFRYKASLLVEAMPDKNDVLLRNKILSVRYGEEAVLDALAAQWNVDFSDFLRKQAPYLTTDQVEKLIGQGFHFGAHSVDHPEYQYIDLETQLRQTTRSVEVISNKFGLGYRLFSFPFTDYGVSRRFFEFILKEKKVADFTFGCAGLKDDIFPNHIQRIPLEVNNLGAEEVLRREFLYFWAKIPFGKNTIHRK